MVLSQMTPGTRFRYPDCGRVATLLDVSPCGARVIFDGSKRAVAFSAQQAFEEGTVEVEFEVKGKPVLVSAGTDVEVLS